MGIIEEEGELNSSPPGNEQENWGAVIGLGQL